MKKTVFVAATLLLVALLPSCSTFKQGANKNVSANFTPLITQPRYVLYDVNFDNKVTGTSSGKMSKATTKQMLIDLATNNAITNSQSDFLFEPSVSIDAKGNNVSVVVTGYGATYSGFKNVDLKDSVEVEIYINLANRESTLNQGGDGYANKRFAKGKSKKYNKFNEK